MLTLGSGLYHNMAFLNWPLVHSHRTLLVETIWLNLSDGDLVATDVLIIHLSDITVLRLVLLSFSLGLVTLSVLTVHFLLLVSHRASGSLSGLVVLVTLSLDDILVGVHSLQVNPLLKGKSFFPNVDVSFFGHLLCLTECSLKILSGGTLSLEWLHILLLMLWVGNDRCWVLYL